MSPSERSRATRTSAPRGRWRSKEDDSLGFNARFVDQHDRDIAPNGINAPASSAFQPLFIGRQLHGRLAQRAYQNFEQLLRDGHPILPVSLRFSRAVLQNYSCTF